MKDREKVWRKGRRIGGLEEGLEDREKDWRICRRIGGKGEGLEDREKDWRIKVESDERDLEK